MNVRNTIGLWLLALTAIFSSCDALIYDKFENCPQGVYVSFYAMTPCDTDTSRVGKVQSLSVFAFDEEDKLVTSVTENNPDLTADYEVLVPVSNGYFTFIAWTGLNDSFDRTNLKPGVTTKTDLLASLKTAQGIASLLQMNDTILQGESAVVVLPDPKEVGTIYKHTAINMKEISNSIKLIVEFDQVTMGSFDPQNVRVSVSSANTALNIDGSMPRNTPQVRYAALDSTFTVSAGNWEYRLLDLKTGYRNDLKITYLKDGETYTVFEGDLIASILLMTEQASINLDCENDFEVKFIVKDYCLECHTNFTCNIYVNNWTVNSYIWDF